MLSTEPGEFQWLFHRSHAPYDYYANQKMTGSWFEVQPCEWVSSADFGNFMAGYGAGFGPPLEATGSAAIATHAAGAVYNGTTDATGLFGDDKRGERFIMKGFLSGLATSMEYRLLPYWLATP